MVTRTLPCTMRTDALVDRASVLADELKKLQDLQEQAKAAADAFKEQVKEKKGLIAELARTISEQKESRPVECEWVTNSKIGMRDLVRKDTGEVIETKPLELFDNE